MRSAILATVLAAALTACAPHQAPLSDLERAVWATEVPDVIPRPPQIRALEGKPGHPDYERPRAKGRAVLRFIGLNTDALSARAWLAAQGFATTMEPPTGDPPVQWLTANKTWCTSLKCCVTEVGLKLSGGRASEAVAYDYEYGRWLDTPRSRTRCSGKPAASSA
jgi:hypothetical protein